MCIDFLQTATLINFLQTNFGTQGNTGQTVTVSSLARGHQPCVFYKYLYGQFGKFTFHHHLERFD